MAPNSAGIPGEQSWITVDRPGVILETLKVAEEGDGMIVRLYEAWGSRGNCRIDLQLPVNRVDRVDLLERQLEEMPMTGKSILLDLSPFEIVSLKLS
jgi:alpha-mannosidase